MTIARVIYCVGGVPSPLLCNIYLHRLDRAWDAGEHGVLVRYCDDLVVMCATRQQAEAALARLTMLLAGLGLEPKAAKTRIVHLAEGGERFDFLGFHHRLVRGWTPKSAHLTFLARWPSRKAVQQARDRIREITARERLLLWPELIVEVGLPALTTVHELKRPAGQRMEPMRYPHPIRMLASPSITRGRQRDRITSPSAARKPPSAIRPCPATGIRSPRSPMVQNPQLPRFSRRPRHHSTRRHPRRHRRKSLATATPRHRLTSVHGIP